MNALKESISENPCVYESILPIPPYRPTDFSSSTSDALSKSIFYACGSCDGPLIPLSTCVCCKKAITRKCAKCGKLDVMCSHDSCKILIYYGNKVVQRHDRR